MGYIARGEKKVYSNSGARVILSDGRTVVKEFPGHRFVLEKEFVGEKVTRIAKTLTNWRKTEKEK